MSLRLKEHSLLLVKYYNPDKYAKPIFLQYRARRGRDLEKIQSWLSGVATARYCIIFAYSSNRSLTDKQRRGQQRGYIDKNTIQYSLD